MTLVTRITELAQRQARVLVAIDGPDAAGKTTLADQLAAGLSIPHTRASFDDWHHPAEHRYRLGRLSPEGYYADAFDHDSLRRLLLEPFAAGHHVVRTQQRDHDSDAERIVTVEVPQRSVLIVDGVFLLRPELRDFWDLSVYLHVSPETTLERGLVRDLALFGSADEVRKRYSARYLPGQAIYRASCDPMAAADLVIDNTEPDETLRTLWES